MTSTRTPTTLTVRTPAELLAAVPYLLGFHPTGSLVVVAFAGRRVVFAARADIPDAPQDITHMAEVVGRQPADGATIIAYGVPADLAPVASALRAALADRGLGILDALWAHGGRFGSYLCDDPGCCPPGGSPYDVSTSAVAAAATYAGQVALPDREALIRHLAPLDEPARVAMAEATDRAWERLAALLEAAPAADLLGRRALARAGITAVTEAVRRERDGRVADDDEVAWLSVLLLHVPVRDVAWARATSEADLELWADVARRARPDLVPAPASLLAFTAWRTGRGALASVALDRALAEDPTYRMATLLREALDQGLSPRVLDGRRRYPRWTRSGPA